MEYHEVQLIAKRTIEYIMKEKLVGISLREIREKCERKMLSLGADSFWYWDIGAFVFSGNETAISVSGREYVTSERMISENDIITIDLSPQVGDIWGDYARTIIIENGIAVEAVSDINNSEWRRGLELEELLHRELIEYVRPETTFEELYEHINALIRAEGFVNLDFMGNLGHSIVRRKEDRIYIESGNKAALSSVELFTFEPHIAVPKSKYGFKKENIYYFNEGKLAEL